MFNPLQVFLLFSLLASITLAASLARCYPVYETCKESLKGISENILKPILATEDDKEKYRVSCEDFKKCTPSFMCNATSELIRLVENINIICEASLFKYSPISLEECDQRMFTRNSTCIREYNPYPDKVEDPVLNEKIQKKFCDEFFGKDNCLEKEMSEACGEEVWRGFKKNQLDLNKVSKNCIFD